MRRVLNVRQHASLHLGVFDCSERALVDVVERMSARNIRAAAHAPRSQRTLNMSTYPNLELKTDRFHVVHRPVTPLTVASGRRGGAET